MKKVSRNLLFAMLLTLTVIVAIIAVFAVIGMDPPKVLLVLISVYVLSGFVVSLKKPS